MGIVIFILLFLPWFECTSIDLLDQSSMGPHEPNYCNNTHLLEGVGLIQSTLGQFLGYECSVEFFHCRWQSDGFRTYKKNCRVGLVYDTLGTQNCNYDYNVKGCKMAKGGACNSTQFTCSMSESCVPLASRCDGRYDCAMEEDEHNCPMCSAGEFACLISEQCVPLERRCNGQTECNDGSDEWRCDECGMGRFLCGKSGECVDASKRCDGERNCPHGEDEILCRVKPVEKLFTCRSRDAQIPMNQVCDGRPNCQDESDELYCEHPLNPSPTMPRTLSSLIAQSLSTTTSPEEEDNEEEEEEEADEEDETSTERTGSGGAPLFPVLSISFPFTAKPFHPLSTRPPPTVTLRSTVPPTVTYSSPRILQSLKSSQSSLVPLSTTRPMYSSSPPTPSFPGASRTTLSDMRSTVSHSTVSQSTALHSAVSKSAVYQPTVIPPMRQSAWRTTEGGIDEQRKKRPGTVGMLPSTVEMMVTATSPPLIVYEKEVTIPAKVKASHDEMRSTIITSHLVTERVTAPTSKQPRPHTVPTTEQTRAVYQIPNSRTQLTNLHTTTTTTTTSTRNIHESPSVTDTTRRGHYPTRVDSSEENTIEKREEGGPRNQVARSLPDTRLSEHRLEELRVSNPRVLAMKLSDDYETRMSTSTPLHKSTHSIVDAQLLKKIGARLNLHSGKSISSRSLLTKIEEVLREELPGRVNEAKKEGRSLRSLGNSPRTERDDLHRIATLKVFTHTTVVNQDPTATPSLSTSTETPISTKPRFSFRIMEERPSTQSVKQVPV